MSDTKYDFVGGDGGRYGPFSPEELNNHVNQGRANLQSPVREAGTEGEWQQLGEVLGGHSAGDADVDVKELGAAILASKDRLKIGRALGDGWAVFRARPGLLIGAVFVYMLIMMGSSMVPMIGPFAQMLLMGPLTGGLFILILKLIRTDSAQFSDLFLGLQQSFGKLLGVGLMQSLISFLAVVPGVIMVAIAAMSSAGKVDWGNGEGSGEEAIGAFMEMLVGNPLVIFGFLWMVLVSCLVYLLIWFVLPLAADRDMGFVQCFSVGIRVSLRNLFPLIVLSVLGGIVVMISALPLGLGMIVTIPWLFAVQTQAYLQMFSPGPPANEH